MSWKNEAKEMIQIGRDKLMREIKERDIIQISHMQVVCDNDTNTAQEKTT